MLYSETGFRKAIGQFWGDKRTVEYKGIFGLITLGVRENLGKTDPIQLEGISLWGFAI